jgi:phage tail sheath protein FI
MPEYLAPGVYVEETSFRAKSIEGVGTSTTAFVGPTRKGPLATTRRDANGNLPAAPELLTSFGDFVRIFGGLEDLVLDGEPVTNYLAHGVLNYFNEGGVRLYVARVANTASAASLTLAGGEGANDRVIVRARFPGRGGNGRIVLREILSPATGSAIQDASDGTVLRAKLAELRSSRRGPYALANGSALQFNDGTTDVAVTFQALAVAVRSTAAVADPVAIAAPANRLTVRLDGEDQAITVPAGDYTRPQLLEALNSRLRGVTASFAAAGQTHAAPAGPAVGNELVLTTSRRGHAVRLQVTGPLGPIAFPAGEAANAQADDTNAIADLDAVSVAEIAAILGALDANNPAEGPIITAREVGGRLVINAGPRDGDAALVTLSVTGGGPPSALPALGLADGATDRGIRGVTAQAFTRTGDQWLGDDGVSTLTVGGEDDANVAGEFLSIAVVAEDADGESVVYDETTLSPGSRRYIGDILGRDPSSRAEALQNLYWLDVGEDVTAFALLEALFTASGQVTVEGSEESGRTATLSLADAGGTDGGVPDVLDDQTEGSYAAALAQLRGVEDISIIAAPGHSAYGTYRNVQGALISHVEQARAYRIAVLDTPPNQIPGEARDERARLDSTRAALYYPWVVVANPLARPGRDDIAKELPLPPSAFLCGIYARNDVEQGVAKAPANEVVRGALRFESDINFAQNQLLNPLGVNCLRFFPGRGYRVWGARTISSDPEWKYVNVRRYFLYLEASIDRGTQWAVFENNGPRLWANVRETIESFLYNEWISGNLLGSTPKEAYFVRCDRSTMTQNDLDNGRLICLIGIAVLKPAEFVIFRIGQKTADARS